MIQVLTDVINVSSYGKEKKEFNEERGAIIHYCPSCKKVCDTKDITLSKKKQHTYTCNTCNGRVATGTEEGIKEHYRLK